MQDSREGYRHHIPMDIRFGDLDSLGHVNNARYITYIEAARVRYFRDAGLWDGTPSRFGLIVAKITMDFLLPLVLSDRIEVYTRVSRLGNKSMDSEHIIARADGALAATSFAVLVTYDYKAQVSIPIPESWRAWLTAYEPGLRNSKA